jgi:hypothetical protein
MKIFLAGGENEQSYQLFAQLRPSNVFLSYYYLRKRSNVKEFLEDFKRNGINIALDSGAHTFLAGAGKSKVTNVKGEVVEEDPDTYCLEYIDWLKKYGDYFEFYVELDIDSIVGYEKVLEYRKLFKENGLQNKLVLVWHSSIPDSIGEWEKCCKESQYVAIAENPEFSRVNTLIDIARKYKRKVHGFAMTKPDYIAKFPFYSVDSTSWKSGSRFGTTYCLQGNRIVAIGKEERRRIMGFDYYKKYDIDWDKVLEGDNFEIDKINAIAWIEYEKIVDQNQTDRYWEIKETKTEEPKTEESIGNTQGITEKKGKLGDIQEKLKDPAIKQKWLETMKGNLFHLKTGKYLKSPLPLYCNNCYAKGKCPFYQEPKEIGDKVLCALREDVFTDWFGADNFDYREEDTIIEAKNKIITYMLQRLGLQMWFEALDGGIQDKAATMLATAVYSMLKETPTIRIGGTEININKQIAVAVNNLDEESKRKIIQSFEQLEASGQEGDSIPVEKSSV